MVALAAMVWPVAVEAQGESLEYYGSDALGSVPSRV